MSDPLVSVLIPCFNAARYIKQAVQSCLSQKWANLEVIVVDDRSTDQSLAVLRSINNKRVKVFEQQKKGASAARNYAYLHAQGEYIQYLDADDFLSSEKISSQIKTLLAAPQDYLSTSRTMHFFDGKEPYGGMLHEGWPLVDTDNPIDWLIDLLGPERGGMVAVHSWLVPRTITEKCGPWDESLCTLDDGEYFSRVVLNSNGIRAATEGLCYYRKYHNKNSLSRLNTYKSITSSFLALEKISFNVCAKTNNLNAKKALSRHYKDLAYNSYPIAPHVTKAALSRAKELGYESFQPEFPTKAGKVLSSLFGWKVTKRLNHIYHTTIKHLEPR
jgi:glycosyltransferase involved in cell wall biosynthesis